MRLLLVSCLLVAVHQAGSSYVALAPNKFHAGWNYAVQMTVDDTNGQSVSVEATVYANVRGARSVAGQTARSSLDDGQSTILRIWIPKDVQASDGGKYELELKGSGGLTFTNSTNITMDTFNYVTFIQTDKKIYKAGQLVQFRVMVGDKDLLPQKFAKEILIQNPAGSALAKFKSDGTKNVYENEYQLSSNPDLGEWKIVVKSNEKGVEEELSFTVDEYVLPKFEVMAESNPSYLLKSGTRKTVTIGIKALYTYGKGVKGEAMMKVMDMKARGMPPKYSQTMTAMMDKSSGMKDVTLDLTKELESANKYGDEISIVVIVSDETKRAYNTTVKIKVAKDPVNFEFDMSMSEQVYRPNMPFRAVLKVTDPAGMALTGKYLDTPVKFTMKENGKELSSSQVNLQANQPYVVWNIDTVNSFMYGVDIEATYEMDSETYRASLYAYKYETIGNATLNARWTSLETDLEMGKTASFVVDVSNLNHFSSISYMIVSRGNIQAFGGVTAAQTQTIKITTEMCPKGKLVVYGITAENPEVVADSLDLKIEFCQDKMVTPSVGANSMRTGEVASISFDVSWIDNSRSDAIGKHSLFMLGVDKSTIMLQGHNDLDPKAVNDKLEKFALSGSGGGWDGPMPFARRKRMVLPPGGGFPSIETAPKSTGELFERIGLKVLSNSLIRSSPQILWRMENVDDVDGRMFAEMAGGPNEVDVVGAAGTAPKPVDGGSSQAVRKDFPETWIWASAETNEQGNYMMQKKLPDSITSWVISAFAVNENSGLAVTGNPAELSAFNKYFVSLNLPYSIQRGEILYLRATVFNYHTENIDTVVTLEKSDDYAIEGEESKSVQVESNGADSVTFQVVARTLGMIHLNVTAKGTRPDGTEVMDAVSKKLRIKAEGLERMRAITYVSMFTAANETVQNVKLDFSTGPDRNVVPGSQRVMVKVTGDMMGNALNDIDRLLTVPTGCGEQNMITTVPNIYALSYLTAINDLSPTFETKAKANMRKGYTREGNYRWPVNDGKGGGYSAFGDSDQAASTWLTAFVVRSFAQAKEFIPETVDDETMSEDINFLLTRQSEEGLFFELGKVIHDEMTGGTGAGDALSVYIVLSMLEAKNQNVQIDDAKLNQAVNYVMGIANGEKVKTRQYLAAITAYAMALYNPTDTAMVNKLLQYVIDNKAPWEEQGSKTVLPPGAEDSYMYHQPKGPSSIEVTAYCLLAYSTIGDLGKARDLLFFLQKEQNSLGGYRSTQDTIVALQAISHYAAKMGKTEPSTVTITGVTPAFEPKTMNIDKDNAVVLQIAELPKETERLTIRVSGVKDSVALVKVVWFFNTLPSEQPVAGSGEMGVKLKLSTKTSMVRSGLHRVSACLDMEGTYDKMMLLSMDMPSGMQVEDIGKARKENPKVARMDVEEDRVQIYLNEPTKECINVNLEEVVEVVNRKPAPVQYMSYYSPDIFTESEVEVAAIKCDPDDCKCNGQQCPSSLSPLVSVSQLLIAACSCLLISLFAAL